MIKNIGNYGFVEFIDKLGKDITIVNAARVSMGKRKFVMDEKDNKLIGYLSQNKHTSPFRHCQVQFHIKAPEVVARQWYKHIIGAEFAFKDSPWNEISGRYVKYDEEFYIPSTFRKQSDSVKQGSSSVSVDDPTVVSQIYNQAINEAYERYNQLLDLGLCREQARMVLPFSTYTEWYWTASLQAIKHFVTLRTDSHAQKEIQEYASVVDQMMSELYPVAWNLLKIT